MHDEKKKQIFYEDINQLITNCDYKIIAIAIRKALQREDTAKKINHYACI
jgi:hypothetical protein